MFANRAEAGRRLARKLDHLAKDAPVIFAMPRGGLPVAAEIAAGLRAPIELVFVRKIGAPSQPELAIGAVVDGADPVLILHDDIISRYGIPQQYIEQARQTALNEIERRRKIYARDKKTLRVRGRTIIIVDDGIATGASIEAALKAMRTQAPKHIVLAVPVAAAGTIARLQPLVDEIVCLETPDDLRAIGFYYRDFRQLSDAEVLKILEDHNKNRTRTKVSEKSGLSGGRDSA